MKFIFFILMVLILVTACSKKEIQQFNGDYMTLADCLEDNQGDPELKYCVRG